MVVDKRHRDLAVPVPVAAGGYKDRDAPLCSLGLAVGRERGRPDGISGLGDRPS